VRATEPPGEPPATEDGVSTPPVSGAVDTHFTEPSVTAEIPPDQPPASTMQQYIVSLTKAGRQEASKPLVRFLEHVRAMPAVEVIKIVGDPDNPKRVIMRAAEDRAADLKTRFGGHLIIEVDQELKLMQ
jgi:hypothetical protein